MLMDEPATYSEGTLYACEAHPRSLLMWSFQFATDPDIPSSLEKQLPWVATGESATDWTPAGALDNPTNSQCASRLKRLPIMSRLLLPGLYSYRSR